MLSEGWDAKTVTHIMGLRAFSSQLLCEQVVGRGLRRTSTIRTSRPGDRGMPFEPEYVNIFGVPFTFLPHEGGDGPPPPPPPPKTQVEPVAEKRRFEISWPNVAPHRPRLHARPDARHGAGAAAGDRREPRRRPWRSWPRSSRASPT